MDIRKYLLREFSTLSWIALVIFINVIILVINYPSPQYIGEGRITWRGVVYTQQDITFVCRTSTTVCVFQSLISLIIALGYPLYPIGIVAAFIYLLNKWIYFLKLRYAVDNDPTLPTYYSTRDTSSTPRNLSQVQCC